MTRLSISTAAVLLTITIAPAAQAFGTDPAPETLGEISQISLMTQAETAPAGTCTVKVSPAMADMLGLPDDWRIGDQDTLTAIACNGDE
ncbi:MAG: hypothetical protein AAFY14_06745 [Pseudomonadota bacterium]